MATVELTFTDPEPNFICSFDVGGMTWHDGSKTLTGVRAKLSAGTATFNLKVAPNGAQPNGLVGGLTNEAFGTLAWILRADDLEEGTGASDGDPVTVWSSYTDGLSNFRQTTSGSQPLLKTDLGPGDNTPTVHFDGTDDRLDSYQVGRGLFNPPVGQDFTLFFVIGDLPTTSPAPLIGRYDTGETDYGAMYGRLSRMRFQDNNENVKQTNTDLPAPDQIRSIQFVAADEKSWEYVNGDLSYGNSAGPKNVGFTFNSIGAWANSSEDEYLNGGISEAMMFLNSIGDDEREIIEGYLAHRWGLTGNLDAGHPYKTTDPFTQSYVLGSNLTLTSSYPTATTISESIDDGDQVTFYLPNCQAPGILTVELTFS
jgi:hypothetical protein